MSGRGIDAVPLRIPERWSATWFEGFVRDVLALGDARNAIEGVGVSISGQPDEPATIAASADIEALNAASLLTVLDSDLDNGRRLIGEPNVIDIDDNGAGESAVIVLEAVPFGKLLAIPADTVLGNPTSDEDRPSATQLTVDMAPDSLWTHEKIEDSAAVSVLGRSANSTGVIADIAAAANDRVLARVSDALSFAQLTAGMFPATVVPDAALSANVALYDGDVATFSSGTFADARIAESSVTQHEAALSIAFSQLSGTPAIPGGLSEYADDAAAEVGGIAVDGLYRTGSVIKIRVA